MARVVLFGVQAAEHRGSGERERADCVLADGVDEARPVERPTGSRTLMELVPCSLCSERNT